MTKEDRDRAQARADKVAKAAEDAAKAAAIHGKSDCTAAGGSWNGGTCSF